MQRIVIDLSELEVASESADEFALKITGEEHLLKLIDAKNKLEELYKNALAKLTDRAFEYNKNVKVIDGAKLRVSFSRSGKKYQADLEQVEPEFVKVVKSLDTDKVGKYIKKHEELPKNVKMLPDEDRPLSVRVRVKNGNL